MYYESGRFLLLQWDLIRLSITIMLFRSAVITFFIALVSYANLAGAASSPFDFHSTDGHQGSVSSPLPPEYVIEPDGSVTLRVCFNWSCASRQTMSFTPDDIKLLKNRVATCPGTTFHDRLQRVRIGIWQMEILAQKYQPLLANDLAINHFEEGIQGRMDCIDNSSNTTTYLHILRDIGELPGWTVSSPHVRNGFDITAVHWTAVIIDANSGVPWSVDSWYRPNGHLPMVMPLQAWIDDKIAWKPPFEQENVIPKSIYGLCNTQ